MGFPPNSIIKMPMMRWQVALRFLSFGAHLFIYSFIHPSSKGRGFCGRQQQWWSEPVQQQSANEPTNPKGLSDWNATFANTCLCFTCAAFGLLIGLDIHGEQCSRLKTSMPFKRDFGPSKYTSLKKILQNATPNCKMKTSLEVLNIYPPQESTRIGHFHYKK